MAALATAPTVSVEEYLHSVYEPDMDLVDGELQDRNVGEIDHYKVQRALLLLLAQNETAGGYYVVQETRMQVSPTRFRASFPATAFLNESFMKLLFFASRSFRPKTASPGYSADARTIWI